MRITKKAIIGIASLFVAAGALVGVLNMTSAPADALTMENRRDCGFTDTIVDCGTITTEQLLDVYDKNDDRRGNKDIQAIFAHYGIKRTDITGATSTVKKGRLNTNGTITVDGVTVADNAQSLYRAHPGKTVTPITIAGKQYFTGPVAGNYGLAADVFVFLNSDGTFRSAIQASCGNPIAATNKVTPPKPVYKCETLTAKAVNRTTHDFTVKASATNAEIVSYNYDFGNGKKATTTNTTVRHDFVKAGTYTVTVTVNVKVNGKIVVSPVGGCKTTVVVKEEPKVPVYKCDSLKMTKKIDRTTYQFTAAASATNAKIVNYTYNFGNGKTATTGNTVTHNFGKAGTYTVTVTANVEVNGKIVPATSAGCKVTITVPEEPKVPVFKCESLKITKITNRTEVQFTATASATNATIKSYTFKFGDGSSNKVVPTSNKTASTTHKYADKAGTYTAEVVVTMSDGKVAPTTANCKVTVKINTPSITIEKTVNGKEHDKVAVGTEFTYEIVVKNTGNVVLKNAAVSDRAPSQVKLLSASAGKINGNNWTYTIPELKVGESKSFTITAKYLKYAAGTHKNNVCVDTPTIPGGPDDCDDATTETDEPIEVCDLTDNTVKTIERSEFDEETMTTDLSKCGEIKVCIIEDKVIKVIAKKDYDETTMTTDFSKCAETPVTPPELPQTGIEAFIGGTLGLGSMTAAGYYWSASRRNLLNALLRK